MRPTAAQENPARSSGNLPDPGRMGKEWPSLALPFPPASPELVPGSGLREAPAISPLHLPSSKDPFPSLPASPPATELPEYP